MLRRRLIVTLVLAILAVVGMSGCHPVVLQLRPAPHGTATRTAGAAATAAATAGATGQ